MRSDASPTPPRALASCTRFLASLPFSFFTYKVNGGWMNERMDGKKGEEGKENNGNGGRKERRTQRREGEREEG